MTETASMVPGLRPLLLPVFSSVLDDWNEKCLPRVLTSVREAAASVRRLRPHCREAKCAGGAGPGHGDLAEIQEVAERILRLDSGRWNSAEMLPHKHGTSRRWPGSIAATRCFSAFFPGSITAARKAKLYFGSYADVLEGGTVMLFNQNERALDEDVHGSGIRQHGVRTRGVQNPALRVCSRKRISSEPPCHVLDHSGLNEGEACC